MTTLEAQPAIAQRAIARPVRLPLRGVAHVAGVMSLYAIYGVLRNVVTGSAPAALRNATQVLGVERFLHLDIEQGLQHATLQVPGLLSAAKVCYSLSHLIVPAAVLLYLYLRAPARYRRWCATFLFLLGLALVGFWLYPLMPPHLMPHSYHFADTSRFFTIDRGGVRNALGAKANPTSSDLLQYSNPYAAMPSLHFTWAVWTALALWPLVRRRFVRGLLVAYPVAMLFAVMVTANHWWLDAVGGAAALAIAYALARLVELRTGRRSHEGAVGTASTG
jgi:hypothetical protein